MPGSNIEAPGFIKSFYLEMKNIAENVFNSETVIAEIIKKAKKPNKFGRCLSYFCQNLECQVIRCLNDAFNKNNRQMDVLIHDGGFVRRQKGELSMPLDILRTCEAYVKETIGYDIVLCIKEIDSSLDFTQTADNLIPANIIIDDVFAAQCFVTKYMEGRIKYSNMNILVFDENTGLWTTDEVALRSSINKYNKELKFEQFNEAGKLSIYNYSGNETNITKMIKSISVFCKDDDFINKNVDSSRGKLLFSD
jgi:hypothetical protein